MTKMTTWVNALYAVHPDMKSHTGGVISFGKRALMSKSTKQKINTKSLTKAELVGISDYLTNTIWARMFLDKQGFTMKENNFYQDNKSTIKLAVHGRKLAGKQSRHIDIRYFYISDQVQNKELKVQHCPTNQMLADFFTKPLQGALFQKF